ncbi:MAG: DMT family transporter [Planctomycetaceae bacterium]|nr:DMT family transporter [Planctomycetaceae bacterium]
MRPYLLMLGGAFSFAVMGALTHAVKDDCDWQLIALSRSLIAATIAGLLVIWERSSFVVFRPPTLWIRSLAGSASVLFNFYALTRLPIADALTLTNMFPVWIAVLSWPVLGKFPEKDVWLGIGCGIVGVFVMQQPYLAEGNLGTLAAVSGSVTSAIALMGLHRLRHITPNAVVVHFSTVSVLTILLLLCYQPAAHSLSEQLRMPAGAWIRLICVGLAATTGQMLLTRAFAAGAPARLSVVGLSQVAFAMIFDVVLWHRGFNRHSLIGMFLIMVPTAWLMLRKAKAATTEVDLAETTPTQGDKDVKGETNL